MLKIALCDDSPLFLEQASGFTQKWSEESRIPTTISSFHNGDDLISAHQTEQFDIIFLTSSPEFALESYEVRAQGYLLKPINYEKIKEYLDECAKAFAEEPKNLIIKTTFGYQKLYFHEIEYAEAQNKRVVFHLCYGDTVESMDAFHFFENKLTTEDGFFKCHRSYLVYLQNVDRFSATELSTKSGQVIPISRNYAKAFKDAYFAQMFQDS